MSLGQINLVLLPWFLVFGTTLCRKSSGIVALCCKPSAVCVYFGRSNSLHVTPGNSIPCPNPPGCTHCTLRCEAGEGDEILPCFTPRIGYDQIHLLDEQSRRTKDFGEEKMHLQCSIANHVSGKGFPPPEASGSGHCWQHIPNQWDFNGNINFCR